MNTIKIINSSIYDYKLLRYNPKRGERLISKMKSCAISYKNNYRFFYSKNYKLKVTSMAILTVPDHKGSYIKIEKTSTDTDRDHIEPRGFICIENNSSSVIEVCAVDKINKKVDKINKKFVMDLYPIECKKGKTGLINVFEYTFNLNEQSLILKKNHQMSEKLKLAIKKPL